MVNQKYDISLSPVIKSRETLKETTEKRWGGSLCTNEPIWDKPKGMHWNTFERLKREAEEATARTWREAARLWRGNLDAF